MGHKTISDVSAGNLARYKGGTFIIQANEWKSFLFGHHLFMDLPSDQRAFQFDRKQITLDGKWQNLNVIRIGRTSDMSPRNFDKLDCFPPQINSLRLQQQKPCRDTELAIVHVHVDLFVGAEEDSLSESASVVSNNASHHRCPRHGGGCGSLSCGAQRWVIATPCFP
jgi:hypothetical protein